jgi:exodeoxyribonuclease III
MVGPMPAAPLRVVSWNVNGLRSVASKGFDAFLARSPLHVLALQEVRAGEAQVPELLRKPEGFSTHFVCAQRKGYSGVALYSRLPWERVDTSLGSAEFDDEGRLQMAHIGKLLIVNGYFPNGNGKERDNSRVPYKLAFYRRLFETLEAERRAGRPILVLGDFNTAHREIDLARPKENAKTSGFLLEEREEFDRWIRTGWVDTFRAQNPDARDAYTWWSQRFGVRKRNVGWRIDYVLASPGAMPFVKQAFHWPDVMGSDHCPVGVDLDRKALGAT